MGIISYKDYLNEDKSKVYSGSVLKKYNENLAKQNLNKKKNEYDEAVEKNLQNIKNLNLDYSLKPLSTGTDKTLKNSSNYLPTAENLAKAKQNQEIINNSVEVQNSRKAVNKASNELRLAQYQYDVAKEENHDPTLWDKTVGVPIRATKDLLSMFSLTNNPSTKLYKDDNGNKSFLPTANEIRQQNVSNSYETKVGKLLSDITYNGTKILGSSILPGGNVVYWGDMFNDSFINTVNDGYNKNDSLLYATLSTASELITSKLMGGLSKLVPGGNSNLSKTINKTLSKVMKNDRLRSVLSNALSEGSEEFVQEYVDLLNRNLVLGENNKLDLETFENALYSGLVGMGTGGISGAVNVDVNTNNTGIIPQVDNNGNVNIETYTNQLEDALNKETNPRQAERINDTLNILNMESDNIFSKQVDEVLNGTFNKQNHLTVLEHTPEVLQKLGFKDFPITLTVNKLERIMNNSGKQSGEYHGLGELVKKLPQAIQNPLDIIESYNNSYVLTTDLSDKQDRSIIISLKVDGKGYINDIKIDTNVMTSAYGRNNYDSWMEKNQREGKIVYDIDRGYINEKKLVPIPGLQLSNNRDKLNTDVQGLQLPNEVSLRNDSPGVESPNTIASSVNNDTIKPSKSQIAPLPNTSNMQKNANNELKGNDILKINKNNNKDKVRRETRKWSETVQKAQSLDQKVLEEAMKDQDYTYIPDSNRKQVERANNTIASLGYEGAINKLNSKFESGELLNANDLALSQVLLQKASNIKDVDNFQTLLEINCIAGTELGQAVQSLGVIKKLSPEGQLRVLKRTVDYMKRKGQKGTEKVEITDDMIKTILDSKNSNELVKNMDEVKQQIAEQMTSTVGDKIIAWRYLSMLGNPRTHIRNIVSNTAMKGTMGIKNTIARTFETMLDKVIKNKNIERTKTFKKPTNEVKNFVENYTVNSVDVLKNTSKYSIELELKRAQKVFGNKGFGSFIQKLYDFNSKALELEDAFFRNSTFKGAMAEYLTANGIETKNDIEANPNLVNNSVLYATEESLRSTFQQYNALASYLNQLGRKNQVGKFVLDSLVPFKKTPANILNTGASYSPLGLLKTVTYDTVRLKNGKISLTQYIDNISQGLTGTGIVMLGYTLAQTGLLRTGSDDDKEDKYEEALGKQEYSIDIAGMSFTLDWLSPVAMPLFVGAEISNMKENGLDDSFNMNTMTSMLTTTFDPMMNMSLLQGINNALSGYSENKLTAIFEETLKSYIGQFVPTIGGQIAKTIDPTIRSTSVSKDSGWTLGEQILKTNMAKIPGLTYFLEPSLDVWGNERQRSDNIIIRAFENFIAPYTRKNDITSSIDKELKDVYAETGDDSVIPTINLSKTITFKGEKYQTNASDYTQFKKTYGTESFKYLNKLFETKTYKNASNEEKVKMIKNVYEYAKDTAKKEYLEKHGVEYTNSSKDNVDVYKENSIIEAIKEDVSIDTINYKTQNPTRYNTMTKFQIKYDDFETYQDKVNEIKDTYKGTDNSTIRKQKVFQYINGLNYNKNQKIILFKMLGGYSIKDYQSSIFSYINNLKISKNEKQEIWKYLYGE